MSDELELLRHIAKRCNTILAILEEREKPRLLHEEEQEDIRKDASNRGSYEQVPAALAPSGIPFVRCPHCNGIGRVTGMDCSVCGTLGKVPAVHRHRCPGCAVLFT